MAQKRPTIVDLKAAGVIPAADIERLESISIRLIQIQDEAKRLEEEKGYTDKSSGDRHRGLSDELEELFIIYDLNSGLAIEDYDIYPTTGEASWIDKQLLLELGVDEEIILKATRRKPWSAVVPKQRKKR